MEIKMKSNLSFVVLGLVIVFFFVFSFESEANAAKSTSNSIQGLKIDTVDGVKYSPDKHKKVAGIVVKATDQGEKVFGFSTPQKYEAYHQKVTERLSNTSKGIMTNPTYFYEHTSNHGYGNSISAYPGTKVSSLSGLWDNRVSTVSVAPGSWVRIYQNRYYGGHSLTLLGHESKYYTTNLSTWAMSDWTSWNDQTSSYQTGY